VGCYGQEKIKTPTLDQLASEGIRFTQFYSGSTVCAPSRAALLTGYHSGHGQVRGNGNPPLAPDPKTLAPLLKDAGYNTGIIGKWGMGGLDSEGSPMAQGFDEFVGFVGHKEAHTQYPDYLHRGSNRWDLPEGTYANDVFTSEAVDFVKRHNEKPFFLFLSYTIPHQQLLVPTLGDYASQPWPDAEKKKAGMITYMDQGIAKVLSSLRQYDLDQNTLILFTSDNGPHTEAGTDPEFFQSNGPLRGIKRDLYDGGIRVPMIARWTGTIHPDQTSDQVWAMWDVLPTLLEVAGAQPVSGRDGISLKPTLVDARPVEHGPLYWEFYERGFQQAVRKQDWKLIKSSTGTLELYNLAQDIGEDHNLAGDRPEVVMELLPLLTEMRTESERWKISEAGQKKKKNSGKKKQQTTKP
jgi:arylsulfatase A-like enzyme